MLDLVNDLEGNILQAELGEHGGEKLFQLLHALVTLFLCLDLSFRLGGLLDPDAGLLAALKLALGAVSQGTLLGSVNDVLKLLVRQVGKDALLGFCPGGEGANLLAFLGDGEALAGDLLLTHRLSLQGSGVLLDAVQEGFNPAAKHILCAGLLGSSLLVGIGVGLATGFHGLQRRTALLDRAFVLGDILKQLVRFLAAQTLETLNLARHILLFKDGHQRLHLAFRGDRIPGRTLASLELLLCNVVPTRQRCTGRRLGSLLGGDRHQRLLLDRQALLLSRSVSLGLVEVGELDLARVRADGAEHLLTGLGQVAVLQGSVQQHLCRPLGLKARSLHEFLGDDLPAHGLAVVLFEPNVDVLQSAVVLLLCKSAGVGAFRQNSLLAGSNLRQIAERFKCSVELRLAHVLEVTLTGRAL